MRLKAGVLCLAVACAIVAAAWPGTVVAGQSLCPQGAPGNGAALIIHVAGQPDIWCSAQVIQGEAAIHPAKNPLDPGGPPLTDGTSIRNVLKLAGVMPSLVHLVLLTRPNGTPSHLNRAELLDPAASFIGGLPAVVVVTSTQTEYIRPVRTPATRPRSQGDSNSEMFAQTPLDLSVSTGLALAVNIGSAGGSSNSSTFPPGKPVRFSASPTGSGYGYTWNFGAGEQHRGANVSHTFTQGVHDVYVTVKRADGSLGVASTQVNVQPSPKNPAYKPPPKKKSSNNNPSNGGNGNSGGVGLGGNSGTTTTTTTTTPTSANRTSPSQGNQNTPSGGSTTTPKQSHTPRTSPIKSGAHQHAGTIVTGRLISAVTPVSPAQLAGGNVPPITPVNQRVAPAAAVDNGSVKPIAGIAGACAIVLLLLSGAGRELRSLRRSIASARLG